MEEDEHAAEAVAQDIRSDGHDVVVVRGGAAALRFVAHKTPELAHRLEGCAGEGGCAAALATLQPAIAGPGLELDSANHAAYLRGVDLSCTHIEFAILEQLVKHTGHVLRHATLVESVWGYKHVDDAALVKSHISSLRHKIHAAGGNPDMIRTVHGIGYSLSPRRHEVDGEPARDGSRQFCTSSASRRDV